MEVPLQSFQFFQRAPFWRCPQTYHLVCPALLKGPLSHHIGEIRLMILSLEPVGGSAPKFSQLYSLSALAKASAQPFSLSCPAQGSPIPSYRLVKSIILLQNQLEDQLQNSQENLKAQLLKKLPHNLLVFLVQPRGHLLHPLGQFVQDF